MKFDLENIVTREGGLKAEYGLIYGNHHVVIIKAGAGGSYVGYEEKYLKIAWKLHEAHGCTVVCLSNFSNTSFEDVDVHVIREVISKIKGEPRLYYVGNSNGATQGLHFAVKYFDFQRMVLINMPLMLNFHKTIAVLARTNTQIQFYYGEKDPSFSYVPFLKHVGQKETCAAKVTIETVARADHNFVGMMDQFIDLGSCVIQR